MTLSDYQKKEYAKLLDQLDAAVTLAAAGFPSDDHMVAETSNAMPKARIKAHYGFFKFVSEAARASLESGEPK